jgi:GNAT superfamily N-acetyltransferase
MLPTPVSVIAADVPELKRFMAEVIAEQVMREEPLFSDLVANMSGNVEWWLKNQDQCVHLKCSADGRIVGVVLVKDFWNLCSLFVAPTMQGQGLGRVLVASAAEACRGKSPKGAVWLNASPNAVPFYERVGFTARVSEQPLPPGFQPMQFAL